MFFIHRISFILFIYYLLPAEIFPVRCISLTLYNQNNYFSFQIPPRLFFQPLSSTTYFFYVLHLLILLSPSCAIILACTFIPYPRVSVTH